MSNSLTWSSKLFSAYQHLAQQYNSYPPLEHFQQPISAFERYSALRNSRKANRPLSLSVTIPFCANACYYCAKKNIVTKDRSRSVAYLASLQHEVSLLAQHVDQERPIEQLHFGGGTPTFLNAHELTELMNSLKSNFNLVCNKLTQYSIGIDPRETDWPTMGVLRDIGFNRVNIELQGLDPHVQRAINRLQSIEQTQNIVEAARTLQFQTLSISLLYGLPKQTPQSFAQALSEIIRLTPDRVSLQGFNHSPEQYPIQQRIQVADLPSSASIQQMLKTAQEKLSAAGYLYIGMGHFAFADDDFASAQEDGVLQHNIQGYSTTANCDTLGLGLSAVSQIGELYYRNTHDLNAYQKAADAQQPPPAFGLHCDTDMQIKRSVIQALTCQFSVDFASIEEQYSINFKDYFQPIWSQLETMHSDGLLELSNTAIHITPQGRLLTAAACEVFTGTHIAQPAAPQTALFSRAR